MRCHCPQHHGGGSGTTVGGGGPTENPRGVSGPRAFWGLMDSTHLASLAPDSQGVASPTNGENREGRSDTTTDRMTGVGEDGIPHQQRRKRAGDGRDRGGTYRCPHTTRGDWPRTLEGPEGPIERWGGRTDGDEGARGRNPFHTTRRLGTGTPGRALRTQGLQGGRTDGKGEGEEGYSPPHN